MFEFKNEEVSKAFDELLESYESVDFQKVSEIVDGTIDEKTIERLKKADLSEDEESENILI